MAFQSLEWPTAGWQTGLVLGQCCKQLHATRLREMEAPFPPSVLSPRLLGTQGYICYEQSDFMFASIIFKLSCARESKSQQKGGGIKRKLGMWLSLESKQAGCLICLCPCGKPITSPVTPPGVQVSPTDLALRNSCDLDIHASYLYLENQILSPRLSGWAWESIPSC